MDECVRAVLPMHVRFCATGKDEPKRPEVALFAFEPTVSRRPSHKGPLPRSARQRDARERAASLCTDTSPEAARQTNKETPAALPPLLSQERPCTPSSLLVAKIQLCSTPVFDDLQTAAAPAQPPVTAGPGSKPRGRRPIRPGLAGQSKPAAKPHIRRRSQEALEAGAPKGPGQACGLQQTRNRPKVALGLNRAILEFNRTPETRQLFREPGRGETAGHQQHGGPEEGVQRRSRRRRTAARAQRARRQHVRVQGGNS